jgi:putative glycosyltransferase (TIGR04348 family)
VRILIVSPRARARWTGNRVTAERWRRLLRGLGHRVAIADREGPCDVLVALHARRSASAIAAFRRRSPEAPIVVALTGTDLYSDTPSHPVVRRSLTWAARVVALQPAALAALPPMVRARTRVICQSVEPPRRRRLSRRFFDVAVVANLRPVKDPFRAEIAARGLPSTSRLRIRHVGGALAPSFAAQARARADANPRYAWLGERSHAEARRLIADSRVLVLSSRAEGGANVISEAIVAGVPVIASRIPGSVGLLGEGYPGFFPVGDTASLRELLLRAERDRRFLSALEKWCRKRSNLFRPARERAAWRRLLAELERA